MAEGRVKICGLCRREDVLLADEAGADYLGAVVTDGFSRSVPPERLGELMADVRATRVAVLVDEDTASAAERAARLGAGVVQLHGDESPEAGAALADAGPWTVWKAVRAASVDDVARAVDRWGEVADGLLVEGRAEGVVGGGGVRLAPDVAERIREAVPPGLLLVLAGGLTPDTVLDAVARFRPDVVDVSSGVEAELRRKDPERVRRFIREARRGWRPSDTTSRTESGAPQ